MVAKMNVRRPTGLIDNGEWLRPLVAAAQAKTRILPDDDTVARIRAQLLHILAQESMPLVA